MAAFKCLDEFLLKRNIVFLYVLCIGFVVLAGVFDYVTGFEVSIFIFYALPIWLATWYIGDKSGLLFAFISLLSWYVADHLTGYSYAHPLIPHWNAMIRLAFFVFTVLALDAMKAKLRLEELNADFDGLTGILNGRGFRERTSVVFPLIKREEAPYSIVFIDVDNFKQVNDTKGHAEGDRILKEVAATMKASLRASDMPGRLGGDEFVIFLPRTDLTQAQTVVGGLKSKLDSVVQSAGWPIGFSIGVGVFDSRMTEMDAGIQQADGFMYEVKKGGKGRAVFKDLSAKA